MLLTALLFAVWERPLAAIARQARNVARKATNYLKSTGLADTAYFGPEAEFFVFDDMEEGEPAAGGAIGADTERSGMLSECRRRCTVELKWYVIMVRYCATGRRLAPCWPPSAADNPEPCRGASGAAVIRD